MSDIYERYVCVTADCDRPATRHVSWTWPEPNSGDYCEGCAWSLSLGGDTVEPPFGAEVVSLDTK